MELCIFIEWITFCWEERFTIIKFIGITRIIIVLKNCILYSLLCNEIHDITLTSRVKVLVYKVIECFLSLEERKPAPIIFKPFTTSFDEAIKFFQEVYSRDLLIVYLWTARSGYILSVFIVFNLS